MQLALVSSRPQVPVVRRMDQLRSDPDFLVRTAYGALHHCVSPAILLQSPARTLRAPLYLIAEVREITRSELILEMAEISSSVMPSAEVLLLRDHRSGCPAAIPPASQSAEWLWPDGDLALVSRSQNQHLRVSTGAIKRYPRCGRVSIKSRLLGVVPQDFTHRLIALFKPRSKSTKVLSAPQFLGEFFPRYNLTGALQQQNEHLKRLLLQLEPQRLPATRRIAYPPQRPQNGFSAEWLPLGYYFITSLARRQPPISGELI